MTQKNGFSNVVLVTRVKNMLEGIIANLSKYLEQDTVEVKVWKQPFL